MSVLSVIWGEIIRLLGLHDLPLAIIIEHGAIMVTVAYQK